VTAPTESEPKAATSAERTFSRCSAESVSKQSSIMAVLYYARSAVGSAVADEQ
jgi:hypothetical protein